MLIVFRNVENAIRKRIELFSGLSGDHDRCLKVSGFDCFCSFCNILGISLKGPYECIVILIDIRPDRLKPIPKLPI